MRFQALYALCEDGIDEEKLISGELPEPKVLGLLGEERRNWQKYLAALYFNVPPDKAIYVLIGNDVKEALINGDGERLKDFLMSQVLLKSLKTFWTRWI